MHLFKLLIDDHEKFHFGDAERNLKDCFSSDQLVSALANNIAKMYGKKETEHFFALLEQGNLRFSSVFYGLDIMDTETLQTADSFYFLPRPKTELDVAAEEQIWTYKQLKKIEYVSVGLFHTLSAGWDAAGKKCVIAADAFVASGKFAVHRDELKSLQLSQEEFRSISFLRPHVRPGVTVSRQNHHSENFYFQEEIEVVYFRIGRYVLKPFMYFLCDGQLPPAVTAAIYVIPDEGLGGKRSSGMGFFQKAERLETVPSFAANGSCYICLSACFPAKDEAELAVNYELEKRSGFIYSAGGRPLRKRSAMLFKEGSIFLKEISGQMVDVKPDGFQDHPVWLYGKPLLVPFGKGDEEQ
jgi:CRISPR-associated protein Csm4